MSKKFKSFEDIVKSSDFDSIIDDMAGSNLNDSYNHLLDHFKNYSKNSYLELSDFYGLAHCVYGWMPRMLFLEEKLDLEMLNQEWKIAEKGVTDCVDEKFYPQLLKLCGNSIVGLSKLLHFGYPKIYAIIDSNVYKALRLNKKSVMPYGVEKRIPLYRNYMEWISEIDENNEVLEKIRKNAKALNELSKNRLIEFFLYNVGKELGGKS